ncbi:hypothetical protein B5M09_012582, partial [Aphanomyces astaci]
FVGAAELPPPPVTTSLFTKARQAVHCAICNDVVDTRKPTSPPTCSCVACKCVVHRRCLSRWHEQDTSTRHRETRLLLPLCSVADKVLHTPSLSSSPSNPTSDLHLLEHLHLDPTLPASPLHHPPHTVPPSSNLAYVYVQRYAPYVAGGILLGGAAIFGMPAVALTGLGVGISGHTWTQRRQLPTTATNLASHRRPRAESLARLSHVTYPYGKLQALGDTFRMMCSAAEAGLAIAPSADTLLPMTVDLIVDGCGVMLDFVAQMAFVSTLTKGGGRGMEGYALTTFHAALRALAAIDVQVRL